MSYYKVLGFEKEPVQRGEEPRLDLRRLLQLVTFGRPDEEGLLRQVTGITLITRQAQGKTIQRAVMQIDQTLEVHVACHTALALGKSRERAVLFPPIGSRRVVTPRMVPGRGRRREKKIACPGNQHTSSSLSLA